MVQAVRSPTEGDSIPRATSILVLDGNEDHQALSVTALDRRGFRVSVADDAREGVRLARSQPFDVIVLAHKLRGLSGLEALRVFAQQFPKVPKIFVVAEGSEDLALRALDAGASGYLIKTANYHELLPAAVEEQIAKVRDRTRLQRQHKALEETQARYRELVETTASPGFAVDAEGRFVEVNEVFGSLLGFTPEELLEMRYADLLPPGLRGDGKALLLELSRRPPPQRVEVPLRRKDGTEIALEILPGPRRAATDGPRFEFVAQDVTERRRAERELRDLYGWLQAVYEATNDAVLLADRDLRPVQWNAQALELLQVDAETVSRGTADALLERLAARLEDPGAILGAAARYGENPLAVEEGTIVVKVPEPGVYRRLTVPVRNPEGTLIGRLWTFRDITERYLAEAALRESETRFGAVAEQAPVVVWTVDTDLRFLSSRGAGLSALGLRRDEVVGRTLFEYFGTDDSGFPPIVAHRRALAGEPVSYDFQSGDRWYQCHVDPLRDAKGLPVGVIGVAFDISDRVRAERSLREAMETLRALVDSSPTAITGIDTQGNVTIWNRAAECMFGWTAEEVLGKPLPTLPPDRVEEHLRFRKRAQAGESTSGVDTRRLRKDGRLLDVQVSVAPIFDAAGKVAGTMGVLMDVSEKKRHERLRAAIYRISEAASSVAGLDELYRSIHLIVAELMSATNFYITLHDPGAETLTFPYFVDEQESPPPPQKVGKGLTEYVLRTGKSLLADPERFEALIRSGEVELVGPPSIDWLGVPLVANGRTIGAIVVQSYTEGVRYTEQDKELLEFVSDQIAMAIERKRAEQAVRESEARYRLLFENNPQPMLVFDEHTLEILAVNEAAVRHYEYTRDEFLHMTIKDIRPPDDVPALLRELARDRGPLHDSGQWRHKKKDGTVFDVDIVSHVIRFGDRSARLVLATDITDRKLAEEELRRSESKFRGLFEAAAEAILLIDREANLLDVNPAGEPVLGVPRDRLVGRNIQEFIVPDELERARGYLRDVLRGAKVSDPFEARILTADGRRRSVEVRSRSVRGVERAPFVEMLVRDVTDEKAIQRRLMESERLASIGSMAGYVAHEINNPLANISLLVASAERKTKDAGLLEKLAKIKAQRRQAASILSDILSFSKQREIQAVESDLRAIVGAAIDQVAPYRKKSVAVHRSLGDGPVLAEVDPLQMQEVFVNLLKNALEATASGSVTVGLEERGDSLAVRVADTGAGISPDVIDRLFEPFFTTKKKAGGTGLGLALCKNVVAAHGGQIQVSSELGKGAIFTVLIPRRQPRKEESP